MFTGIIEEIGKVVAFKKSSHGADLVISAKTVLEDIELGESIAVNGVCETVVKFDNTTFEVNISDETLRVSNLSDLKQGDFVNLERALKLSDRLSGHVVSGHVDLTTRFVKKEKAMIVIKRNFDNRLIMVIKTLLNNNFHFNYITKADCDK